MTQSLVNADFINVVMVSSTQVNLFLDLSVAQVTPRILDANLGSMQESTVKLFAALYIYRLTAGSRLGGNCVSTTVE
jgi:hypothetical protein